MLPSPRDLSPTPVVLRSRIDRSVNFVQPADVGFSEARYVRRDGDYFIVYLSAQTGCDKGCRFCHLTQTAQTRFVDVELDGIVAQAREVLGYYDEQDDPAREVHFNFMARGEPLASSVLHAAGDRVCRTLEDLAVVRALVPSVKISTIMPAEMEGVSLVELFPAARPDLYYSIYSTSESFRRRWLPRALPVADALAKLVDWQQVTRKIPVLHFAFIEGENDSEADVTAIADAVNAVGLRADVNIVRYNPYSPRQGAEPTEQVIEANATLLAQMLPGARVKVVTRVGFDVAASCGMFVGGRLPVVALPS